MNNTGLNYLSLKQQNRGLILKLIATGECTSRIELAKRTGLSKMAASNIIGEFIAEDVIEEREKIQVQGKGRNPIELRISPRAPKMIGLYIFRDYCGAVLCDLQLNIIKKSSFKLNESSSKRFFQKIYHIIDTVMEAAKGESVYGIGIGSSGPVDIEKGMILNPPNFYGMREIPVVAALKERYNLPVYFDSQYNCAALAEKYYGNAKDAEDFIFAGIANGIGSGIISCGSVLNNSIGFSSELGHVSVDVHGNKCPCGNIGCLETYISTPIVERKLQKITGENYTFRQFCEKNTGELQKKMRPVFEEMIEYLGSGLVSFVNLFNPQKIIIGHESYWIPDMYLKQLEELINARKLSGSYHYVKVEKAFFEDESQFRGCSCSLLSKIFDGVLF